MLKPFGAEFKISPSASEEQPQRSAKFLKLAALSAKNSSFLRVAFRAKAATSAALTLELKPEILKFERCTFIKIAVFSLIASS